MMRCSCPVLQALLLYCLYRSFMMEYDIHTVLDGLTLVATSTVIFCILGTEIKQTYQKDQDKVKFWFVVSTGSGGLAKGF